MVEIYEIEKYKKLRLVRTALEAGDCGKLLFFTGVRYERLDVAKTTSRHLRNLRDMKASLRGSNSNLLMQ